MTNELVSHKNNHAEDIAVFMNSDERFADPVQRRDFLSTLDEAGFIDMLQQTASLVRTGEASSLQHFDGVTVGLMGHEVPDQREKESLLRETWVVARTFLDDNELDDQDALDYTALTVAGGGVLLAHPFADGNGRTSRAISYMISQGSNGLEELRDILASTNGGGNWSVAPEAMAVAGKNKWSGLQPNKIEWDDAFAGEAEDALGGQIADSRYGSAILREFIERNGGQIADKIETCVTTDENGGSTLNGQKFIKALVTDKESGIADAKELLGLLRYFRADYVHRFLTLIKSKGRIRSEKLIQEGYNEANLRSEDKFIRRRTATIHHEVGSRAVGGTLKPIDRLLINHMAYSRLRQHPEAKK